MTRFIFNDRGTALSYDIIDVFEHTHIGIIYFADDWIFDQSRFCSFREVDLEEIAAFMKKLKEEKK